MSKENIILIGFMGSGKSTIGKKLARALEYRFLDTDELIEERAGKTITQIFAEDGEATFRRTETELLEELIQNETHCIIATGGGMPLRPENAACLKKLGMVVLLNATPETILERLKEDTQRPLLQGDNKAEKVNALYNERFPKYTAAADYVVNTDDKTFYSIINEIETLYKEEGKRREK